MNDCVRNWNMDDDFRSFHSLYPTGNQRKSIRPENELVELLWQNGHVVMHNQNNRDPTAATINEHRETQRLENPNNPIQQDDQSSWMNFPLDDPLTKDFYSDFFYGMPTSDFLAMDKMSKFGLQEEANLVSNSLTIKENSIPPTTSQTFCRTIPQNFAHFSRPGKLDPQIGTQRGLGESSSSMVSKLSGDWGNNQVHKWTDLSSRVSEVVVKQEEDAKGKLGQSETHDATTVTSSSGGSEPDVGRIGEKITRIQNQKRKGREVEESESYSKEAEYQSQSQSLEIGRRPQRSTSSRRSRVPEVHNLSERRRRDRINEKMRALQELIPHCNKTDKASMLDEAIEYLKSLQLQVQIMWMGSGMTPMVFPIAQKYLSLMGRVTDQGSIPAIPGLAQIPRVPISNQPLPPAALINHAAASPPILSPPYFPNQIRNSINVLDAYAHFFGLQNMQPPSQQSQPAQPTQRTTLTGSNKPPNVACSSENFQNGNTG